MGYTIATFSILAALLYWAPLADLRDPDRGVDVGCPTEAVRYRDPPFAEDPPPAPPRGRVFVHDTMVAGDDVGAALAIERVLMRERDELAHCFDRGGMWASTELHGTIAYDSLLRIGDLPLDDATTAACVRSVLHAIDFPYPLGVQSVHFTTALDYQLGFEPQRKRSSTDRSRGRFSARRSSR